MIDAVPFAQRARELGFGLWTGVPCSYLEPFINHVIDAPELRYVGATNEGDAVAIAAGAELGGLRGVAIFQNSGLGNAVSPLTSLTHVFRIPVLVIATLRGEPGGAPDEPQHALMGAVTTRLLDLIEIPWERFPEDERDVGPALERAVRTMDAHSRPFAFVLRKSALAEHPLATRPEPRPVGAIPAGDPFPEPVATRRELLAAVQRAARPDDVLVATTGYTGRELFALGDRENQLYLVGSMGCASSLGLGLALARPDRRVVVLDGDGAALMRLGALATLGYERPPNLLHVLLDNGRHESTGGQSTVSHSVDFAALAAACGYPRASRVIRPRDLAEHVADPRHGLAFVHVRMQPGTPKGLPRPDIAPEDVARRLRAALGPLARSVTAPS